MKERDFLAISDLTSKEIFALFKRAKELKKKFHAGQKLEQTLKGKNLALIFEKPSTRTRVSFEVGMEQLGGHAIFLSAGDSHLGRGEPIEDTARILSRYVDGIVIRTYSHEAVETLAQFATIPVINALTDLLHPCQALADLFTIQEQFGDFKKMPLVYVGDGNNVCHSWIMAAAHLGVPLQIACPKNYGPSSRLLERVRKTTGYVPTLLDDAVEAVRGAKIVYTDVWVSMGQEAELKKLRALEYFQVNGELLKHAAPNVKVMHCLPAHRGEEISMDVFEKHSALIFEQAENRLHVQKALMEKLLADEK
ncbi:MAG: ornithine carbamoyltransferase [Deltaproteobacteria bacterium]|nr:ornithine carbamoyltransferase [Deltaproteobacteria bacterium]